MVRITKPATVAEYVDAAPEHARGKLREMRKCLHEAAPDAEESLKWGMPAFSHKRILFTFAAFKRHISLFPTPSAVKAFAKELSGFRTSTALDKPLPLPLIRRIAAFRVREVVEKDAKWM